MPQSKTGAGPGLNRAFFTSQKKNNPRLGQNLALKIDWTRGKFKYKITQDWGNTGAAQGIFLSQRNKK